MISDESHLESLMAIKALLVEHESKIKKLEAKLNDAVSELKKLRAKCDDDPIYSPDGY